ncbi:MAG: NUDIX domain-containing protein [Patescibacteria group bacterium]|jgi:ADP-ribose pyrophosphatase YjhB (NUDIX family)
MNKYDGQVESVVAPIIVNDEGKILLMTSPKWGDKYTLPGGHIEYGETLSQAAEREAKEESGLDVKALYLVDAGTMINSPEFFRKQAHFVYHRVACKVVGGELNTDSVETTELVWVTPEEALKLPLATGMEVSIKNYINGVKLDMGEYVF